MTAITVRNLQRRVPVDLPWLRRFAGVALAWAAEHSADEKYALRELDEIGVVLVSDRRIAQLHREFMDIEGPTDVLTFDQGDIVISAETARVYAAKYGQPVDHEIALYLLHGLLHLNGFDDRTAPDRKRMQRVQARLFTLCLKAVEAAS